MITFPKAKRINQNLARHWLNTPFPQLHWSWAKRLTHYTFLPGNKPCSQEVGPCWLVSTVCLSLSCSPGVPCPLVVAWIWPMGGSSRQMEGGNRESLGYLFPLLLPCLPGVAVLTLRPQVQLSLDSGHPSFFLLLQARPCPHLWNGPLCSTPLSEPSLSAYDVT